MDLCFDVGVILSAYYRGVDSPYVTNGYLRSFACMWNLELVGVTTYFLQHQNRCEISTYMRFIINDARPLCIEGDSAILVPENALNMLRYNWSFKWGFPLTKRIFLVHKNI